MRRYLSIALAMWFSCMAQCFGTTKFFPDIVAVSPDGEWKVTAVSPDNAPRRDFFGGPSGWQSRFVYSAFKDRGATLAWTRKQSEQEPPEYSPLEVVVSNNGWAAIHTAWDRMVFVDSEGRNRGRVDDLKDALPQADLERYGIDSTGGLVWTPKSLWYFLPGDRQQLFVVRTWWGRRIVISPESGETIAQTDEIDRLATKFEKERAMWLLGEFYGDFAAEKNVPSILLGVHLAGALRLKEAIPVLRELEQSEYASQEILSPFTVRFLRARQNSRLALRRLGEATTLLPTYEFATPRQGEYLRPAPLTQPVETVFPRVKKGMTVEEVLQLVGSPDYVLGDAWEFDTAGETPATLVIEWKADRVWKTRKLPAKWQDGWTRDRDMVMF